MPDTLKACLPAELYGKDRKHAAERAVRERPDNTPSWQAVQEVAAVQPSAAVFLTGALWPEGRTIDVSFMNVSDSDEDKIRHDLEELYGYSNLKLRWVRDPGAGEIRISRDPRVGSWSYLGSQALQIHRDRATMNLGWLDDGVVFHEGGHSLGMGHAHKSPNISWEWDERAVIRDLSGPPNNWSVEQIRHNVLDRYGRDEVEASAFDPRSMMLYAVPEHWTIGDYEYTPHEKPSATDIEWIRRKYPPGGTTGPTNPTDPTDPPKGADMDHLLVIQGKGPGVPYSVHFSGKAEFTEKANGSIQANDQVVELADGTSLAHGWVAGGRDVVAFEGRILSHFVAGGKVGLFEHREHFKK